MRIDDERGGPDAAALFGGGLRGGEPSSGPCLSEELILAFSEGRSTADELERLHAHLDGCGACLDLVNAAVHRWDRPPTPTLGDRPWLSTFGPGQKVARRYRVDAFIGRGGMGEVYLAFDQLLGERVALKMPLPALSDNPAAIGRLLNEARLARRIQHDNVCRVHDVGVHEEPGRVDERLYFITMEYIDGERLGQLARAEPLALATALDVARQILAGLGAAHASGVLHRDLKSDNIMVGPVPSRPDNAERRVTIMDFGLSARLDRDDGSRCSARERVGSASYMAPEQLHGREVGPATDVFAFGVVLFEMLCGALPFATEGSGLAHSSRRVGECAITPSTLRPDLGPAIDRFILRCLMEKPEDRFASAAEAWSVLAADTGALRPSGIVLRPETLSA